MPLTQQSAKKGALMKTLTTAILIAAAFLFAGCNNKQAEDTAATRAMMEKQQADAKASQERAAAFSKAARESLKSQP